jgi:PAS domain S-box-containing protein
MVLKKEITIQIKDLLQKNPQGLSISDIVKVLKINRNTAGRYLENLLVSGQVEMRRLGMAKIYMLSQRLPHSAILSISSELVLQLDSNLRIIFVNEPFLKLVGTDKIDLLGKNIEYTPVAQVFDEVFTGFIENVRQGIEGREWAGEFALTIKDIIFFCRIAPTVFDDGRKGVTVMFDDITQRKRDKEKIEESERQFRLMAENSVDMISRIKPDGTRMYVSPAYTATLGYEPEELINTRKDEFIHPDDAHIMENLTGTLTPQNPITTAVFRTKHKDGHYIWIESIVRAIFDEKTGELSEFYAVTRDITKRKIAEDALRESEERYRQFVDISPDGVIIHQQGKIIFLNPAALTMLGALHSDMIIGKNVIDLIHPDFRQVIRKNIEKDLQGNITPPLELHMLRVDGSSVMVEGRGVKTTIKGKPAIQVAIRDITERKRTEEALKSKERQLTSFFSNVPDVLSYLSVDEDNHYRFLNVNQTFLEKLQLTEDEVVGKYVHEIIQEPLLSRILKKYNQAILEKKTIEWVEVQDSPTGKRYGDVHITAIFNESGRPTNIIGIVHDSTEHRLVEEALRKSEGRLTALLESITDLMTVIDKNLTIRWANEPAKRYFGNDIIGRKCFEVYHQRQVPCEPDSCSVRKTFQDGKIHHHEVMFIDNQGGKRVFEGTASVALRDNSGITVAVLETAREITERKKAEETLHESEERLRLLLDSTEDIIFLQDPEGRYLYFNATEGYGVSGEKMLGLTPYDMLDKEQADRILNRVKTVVKTGQSIREETSLVWQGKTLWFIDSLSPVRDTQGSIIAVVTISHNITARKHAETALRESEATARALINAPTDSVILADPKGRILALNETAALRFGKRSDELIGVLGDDLLPEKLAQSRRSLISRVLEIKEMVRFEDERDGMWFDTVAYPILSETGDVIKVAIVARDITDRKNTERQLHDKKYSNTL